MSILYGVLIETISIKMNKRKRDVDHVRDVRQRMEVENRKRMGEPLNQEYVKRQRLDFSVQEELMVLRASIEELREHQRASYQILAGQAARIRQLEGNQNQKQMQPQAPVWAPWVK